jgi:hypothetical protein
MEALTQTALVRAAQTGDRIAFEALVEVYQRELLTIVWISIHWS